MRLILMLTLFAAAGCDRLEQNYLDVDQNQTGWETNVQIIEGVCPVVNGHPPDCCVYNTGGFFSVVVSKDLSPRNENDCLAHELRHMAYGPKHVGE